MGHIKGEMSTDFVLLTVMNSAYCCLLLHLDAVLT